jgi:hypothetical protein
LAVAAKKREPALTLAQARCLIDHVFRRDPPSLQEICAVIRYHQERNYAAYRAHAKRTIERHQVRPRKRT